MDIIGLAGARPVSAGRGAGQGLHTSSFPFPSTTLGHLSVSRFQLHRSSLGNSYFDTGLPQVVLYLVLRYCNLPTCCFDLRSKF